MALSGYGTKLNAWALRSKLSASVYRRERLVYSWIYSADPFSDFYGINWQISTGVLGAVEGSQLDWLYSTGQVTVEVRFGSQAHPSGGVRFGSASYAVLATPTATGTLAATESGSDLLASLGAVAVSGSLAIVDSIDTFASSGAIKVSGSLSISESGSDTASSSGSIAITGAASLSEANDVLAVIGSVSVSGDLQAQEASEDMLDASGSPHYVGEMAATEAGLDVFEAIAGLPDIIGSANVIEAADRFLARASSISTKAGSYTLREYIFLGRKNVAQFRIGINKTAIDFGGVTRMILVIHGSGIRIDSATDNEAIQWDNTGLIRLRIGGYPIKPSRYWASLIAYDPVHDDGQYVIDGDAGQLQLWCVNS